MKLLLQYYWFRHKDVLRKQSGQALVELLVAMGIAALMLPALATAVVATRGGRAQQEQRLQAAALLREANEAVRIVRQTGWTGVATNGTYFPAISGSTWVLSAGSQSINGFTRSIVISDTQRNSAGAIVTSAGTVDPSTKRVVVTVSWTTPVASSISNTAYLNRYLSNATWSQTTQADFNAGTKANTNVTATNGGQVELASKSGPQYVQSAGNSNDTGTTSLVQAFSSNVTGGNLIVAAMSWDSSTTTAVTCSDNQGNIYTTVTNANDATNAQTLAVCYAPNAAAGATTVTATLGGGASFRRIIVSEYSGVAAVSPVDKSATNLANGTTATDGVTSTAATTTVAGDLIYGVVMDVSSNVGTITAGTGFAQRRTLGAGGMAIQDRVQAAAGSIASTQTFSAANRYHAHMVAFKAVSGSGVNWQAPTIVGSFNAAGTQDALDVNVVGNYAYLCDGTVLSILDISTPTSPVLVGTYTASASVRHVYIDGNYAYLSTINNAGELVIVNISNPATPSTTATVNMEDTNDAYSTFVSGGYAYVGRQLDTTTGTEEFYIINVTNPASPTVMGSVNLTGSVNNIKVSGNYAYLATTVDTTEVVVVNVTNKSSPTVAGNYNAAGTADANDLGIDGTTLYMASTNNTSGAEVYALSIATPATPTLLDTYEVGGNVTGVSPIAGFMFLSTAITSSELIVLNTASPSNLLLEGTRSMGASANDVKASGNLAFVATAGDSFEMRVVGPTTYGGGGGYETAGTFDSSTLNAGASVGFNYITFTLTEPASTDVRLQIATNNDNATWNYVGPDGTNGTYYSTAGTIRITTTGRYARYRATLTGPGTSTPILSDITINYSP